MIRTIILILVQINVISKEWDWIFVEKFMVHYSFNGLSNDISHFVLTQNKQNI